MFADVETMIKVLHDPALPLLEMQVCFSTIFVSSNLCKIKFSIQQGNVNGKTFNG